MMKRKTQKGFSLIEVMVGVAVFALFMIGIYGGITFIFKIVYQSRLRILETGILNEQVEIIRNLPFSDVGIINGSPSGVLTRDMTTTRNGIDFTITRTIRNIDDPFDGVIGGVPNDTAPADYKMIDIEIICDHCDQHKPLVVSTQVSPKLLEGDPTHGALFIKVFDSQAKPVQGATIHIVSTSTNPTLDLTDTTDNDGMLRIVDLGAGIDAYDITVTKAGFTTDQTRRPTIDLPNPVKPPASVQAQGVVEVSFSIDRVSSLQISTINSACEPVGSAPVLVMGTQLIGTDPDVLKIDQNLTTGAVGTYTLSNLDADSYGLRPSSYDLVGTIPTLPVSLPAGAGQPVQLILGPNTANSLLVNVVDSITGQPLSSSTVKITSTGYDKTKTTGVGFVSQTDWSGGDGQVSFTDETKYFSDDGKIEINDPSGDIKLRKVGQDYVSYGSLESSIFDLGTNVNFVNLFWTPLSQPIEAGANAVRFQIAASATSTPAGWNYVGYDGTAGTYFDAEHQACPEILNDSRYVRYQVFLSTQTNTTTPTVSDVIATYITSCTPPGQAYFGSLGAQDYVVEVSHSGYQTKTEEITASGDIVFNVALVVE